MARYQQMGGVEKGGGEYLITSDRQLLGSPSILPPIYQFVHPTIHLPNLTSIHPSQLLLHSRFTGFAGFNPSSFRLKAGLQPGQVAGFIAWSQRKDLNLRIESRTFES